MQRSAVWQKTQLQRLCWWRWQFWWHKLSACLAGMEDEKWCFPSTLPAWSKKIWAAKKNHQVNCKKKQYCSCYRLPNKNHLIKWMCYFVCSKSFELVLTVCSHAMTVWRKTSKQSFKNNFDSTSTCHTSSSRS